MKINIDFTKEDRVEETRKKQQVQEQERVLINSVEPKPNHLLFEFRLSLCGGYFNILQTYWKTEKEIIFRPNKKGTLEEVKEDKKVVKIDLFDPNFKAEKKKYDREFENGVGYITALNYRNAVEKFKKLNPSYFRNISNFKLGDDEVF